MKLKHLLIVSLVLAILTIGAVSASDDADNLTVSDDTRDDISQVEEVDVVAGDDDGDDFGDDGEDYEDGSTPSYDFNVPEEVRAGTSEQYSTPSVYLSFYEDEISGTVSISINGSEVYNESVVSYYSNDYEPMVISVDDLNLDYGINNVLIKYSGDGNFDPFEETYYLKYYYIDVYVPETLQMYGSDNIYISFAEDVTGTLTMWINGTKVYECLVQDMLYDEEMGEYSGGIRIFWEYDIADEHDFDFGEYTYSITYSDGNYPEYSTSGSFDLSYQFSVTNEMLSNDEQVFYGSDMLFSICLPDDAEGNVVLIANGKEYQIPVTDSLMDYYFSDLKMGENNLTFSFNDDKYFKKTQNLVFNVKALIELPHDCEFVFGGNETIGILLPENATGNLVVYNTTYDEEIYDYVASNVIKSVPVENGMANISLSDLKFGSYTIIIKYEGDDYFVEDEIAHNIMVLPKVTFKEYMWIQDDNNVTIESPEGLAGTYKITLKFYDYDVYNHVAVTLYNGAAQSHLELELNGLNATSYTINLQYIEDGEIQLDYDYDFTGRDMDPNWEMEVTFPDEVGYELDSYWYIDGIPDMFGYVYLYVDDELVRTVWYSSMEGFEGENYIDAGGLTEGIHTWKIEFKDQKGYFKTNVREGTFNVVVSDEREFEITCYECDIGSEDDVVLIYMPAGTEWQTIIIQVAKGEEIINSIEYLIEEEGGDSETMFDLSFLGIEEAGTYTISLLYEDWTWSDVLEVNKADPVLEIPDTEFTYGETGNITFNDGVTIDAENVTVEGHPEAVISVEGNVIHISGLNAGTYTLNVITTPNNNFNSAETTATITVNKKRSPIVVGPIVFDYGGTGTSDISVEGADIDSYSVVEHPEAVISVEGNVISVSGLDVGVYTLQISATPDSNHYTEPVTTMVTVNPVDSTIAVDNIETEFEKTGSATFTVVGATVDKENVTVVGHSEAVIEVSGYSISVSGLDVGTYTLNVITTPDKNYKSVTGTATITVTPIDSTISVSDVEFVVENVGSATFTVVGATVDKENVTVEGHPEAVIEVNGNSISVSGLDVGTYALKVTTTPDKNHKSVTGTATIIVKEKPLNDLNMSISVADIEEGSDAVIVITTYEAYSVDVKVMVGDANYTVSVINGKGDLTVRGLSAGNYTAVAIFEQTDIYRGCVMTADFKVNAKSGGESGTGSNNSTNTDSSTATKKADTVKLTLTKLKKVRKSAKKVVLKATLKINGKAVKGKKLKFKFNKKTYTAKTNKKGVAKVTIKKNVLKKLKVGKKVKYQVSYGKKTVKRTIKVKR